MSEDQQPGPPVPTRRSIGVVLAVAAVAAALLFLTRPEGTGSTPGGGGSPTPTPSAAPSDYIRTDARRIILSGRSRVLLASQAYDGTRFAVWVAGNGEDQVLAISRTDGSSYVARLRDPLYSLTPVPSGGLVAVREMRFCCSLLGDDSRLDPLEVSDERIEPAQDDIAVDLGNGPRIYRPSDATIYRIPQLPRGTIARSGFVTADGSLVVSTLTDLGEPGQASGTGIRQDGRWSLSTEGRGDRALPGPVAGQGDTVVVARTRDAADGGIPVDGLRMTLDGGSSWREVPLGLLAGHELTSVAVVGDGALLTDGDGRVYRLEREGGPRLLDEAPQVTALQSVGEYVVGQDPNLRGPMRWTTDGGRTWEQAPPPGLPRGQ
ncbi:hypothetical protein EKO23_09550 [Nocardioides guangzhouensis]|uniref:Exo-alpha-sialidase n=1 Tax=Nocardioides guangzhouensis TaxID=2497878 RepID=A0A4Q4ZDT0_9ACTN|nr:hypothetical protein [Nocardioides guangzhouensis]RYP86197.1 hypothetical protein EKO23_09550 [Nocardioides guangzhouensis]